MKKTIVTLMMAGSFCLVKAQNTFTSTTNNGEDMNNQKNPSNNTLTPTYTGTTNDGMYNGGKKYQDTTHKKNPQNKNKPSNNKQNNPDKTKGTMNDGTKGSKHKSSRDTTSH